jgi:response regulator NasT
LKSVSGRYGIANREVAPNRRRKLRIFSHFALLSPKALTIDPIDDRPVMAASGAGTEWGALRIVIVDDSGLRATVLEEGLREAGYDDIHVVPPQSGFVARIERMAPDVVLMDLGSPSRDTLEEMLAVSRALARPIAMFVDQSDEAMIGAAIDAGVSAYVVDGLRKERVKPVLDLAIRRFNAFARMQTELNEAKTALAERKTVDRAKAILMNTRSLSEADAYALLRSTAMNQNRRIVDVAEALIMASSLLEKKP